MDEIDNIIIHTLRQIGCIIDEDVSSLSSFSPEKLVETVSKCLLLIKPNFELPTILPPGMAQRYSVTTTLAEACASVGFRGDIGYQTFLYSNITEVRRVYMFLIERLPKESDKLPIIKPTDKLTQLEEEIKRNISLQLNSAWTPQYCKKNGITKFGDVIAVQASTHNFLPQKLNIPHATSSKQNVPQEIRDYWLKRSPSVFQQTQSNNLCSSLVHNNDISRSIKIQNFDKFIIELHKHNLCNKDYVDNCTISSNIGSSKCNNVTIGGIGSTSKLSKDHLRNIKSIQQLTLNNIEIPNENDIVEMPEISTIDALNFDIEKLKQSIEQCVVNRKQLMTKINDIREQKTKDEQVIVKLRDAKKIKERTHILLENPEVNITKMGTVLASTEERLKKLAEQWEDHRQPLVERLERAQQSTSKQYSQTKHIMDQIKSTRNKADEVTEDLKNKATIHAQLIDEFEKINKNINRNAYTSRILEIIGNIRKQKNDIDKVLCDTRELQKEINNITGQLDRQFTVTDDLLFKTAKRDEHTKKAYKFLATLHADCSDLITFVQDKGLVMREVRDIEDQIENEKNRNVTENLKRITNDLKLVEKEGAELLAKIKKASDMVSIVSTSASTSSSIRK